MKTYKNLYPKVYNLSNLILAWRKARKGKTRKEYVKEFEKNLVKNLLTLYKELKEGTYKPKPLTVFIIRDPKTRRISKAEFIDRIVHHALFRIIEPIFDKNFIYDSCANRKNKGNLFAIKRFDKFKRKVSNNGKILKNNFQDTNFVQGYCLKADIKHYFDEVNHEILLSIIKRKISDNLLINLIEKIVRTQNEERERDNSLCLKGKGMPLGNLTSQFFANIYLNELDYFIKHELKAKYYIRYVDDFVILHSSKEQLEEWKEKINFFLKEKLKLELHKDKSKIIPLSKGIDFVGFRNFYHFKLLRKRNIRKMKSKLNRLREKKLKVKEFAQSFQGWRAYAKWASSSKLKSKFIEENLDILLKP